MKLVIVNQETSTGGWRYLYFLVKGIKVVRPNYDITIFVSNTMDAEDIVEKFKEIEVKTKQIPFAHICQVVKPFEKKDKFKNKFLNRLANGYRKLLYKIKRKKYIASTPHNDFSKTLNQYDCTFYAWPYGIEAPTTNKPLFFIPHDFIFTHFFGFHSGHYYTREWWWKQYQLLKGFVDKNAHAIVSTPYIAEELKRTFPEYQRDVNVAYLSHFNEYPELTSEEIKTRLDKLDIKNDYILYANNWALHKNMQPVIGAYYLVKQKYPNIKLIISGYGTEGVHCECSTPYYLDHIIETKPYDVKGLGLLDEDSFSALLQGAKLVINSSLCEGGAGSALDAWHAKTPVAFSCIDPFKDQLAFLGTKAEVFDPRNSTDIAEAILRILDNPEKAKQNAEDSFEALSKYTWEDVARQYVNIFEENCPQDVIDVCNAFPNVTAHELMLYKRTKEAFNEENNLKQALILDEQFTLATTDELICALEMKKSK